MHNCGFAHVANQLYFKASFMHQFLWHITLRHRLTHIMRKAAGCGPAHYFALVPNRFIAKHISIRGIDHQGHAAQFSATGFFSARCFKADEIILGEVHKAVQTGFEGAIDWAQFAVPSWEVLFQPHGEKGAHAEINNAMCRTGFHDLLIEAALIVWRYPNFITKIASVGDAVDEGRAIANVKGAMIHEFERGV